MNRILVVFLMLTSISLDGFAMKWEPEKNSVPSAIENLRNLLMSENEELARVNFKLEKPAKDKEDRENLKRLKEILTYQQKQIRKLLAICRAEEKQLNDGTFKLAVKLSCVEQYNALMLELDGLWLAYDTHVNADLMEDPSQKSGWFGKAYELAKGATFLLGLEAAFQFIPVAAASSLPLRSMAATAAVEAMHLEP